MSYHKLFGIEINRVTTKLELNITDHPLHEVILSLAYFLNIKIHSSKSQEIWATPKETSCVINTKSSTVLALYTVFEKWSFTDSLGNTYTAKLLKTNQSSTLDGLNKINFNLFIS